MYYGHLAYRLIKSHTLLRRVKVRILDGVVNRLLTQLAPQS